MVVALIYGGLGNQLFQYSIAYSLAKKNNQKVVLDISHFTAKRLISNQNTPEHLYDFSLKNLMIDDYKTINSIPFFIKRRLGLFLKRRLFKKHENELFVKVKDEMLKYIEEPLGTARLYQPELFQPSTDNIYISGCWQHEMYFSNFKKDIKRQIQPAYTQHDEVLKINELIQKYESVGVHVRRGDFVTLGWDKKIDYYKKAINSIRNRIENVQFFVFSDDPKWVIKEFGQDTSCKCVTFNTRHKTLDDFFSLSRCKHQIISESTFGWWAAYLNDYSKKIVITPNNAKGQIFKAKRYEDKI